VVASYVSILDAPVLVMRRSCSY